VRKGSREALAEVLQRRTSDPMTPAEKKAWLRWLEVPKRTSQAETSFF
jgi:hypothetical protein